MTDENTQDQDQGAGPDQAALEQKALKMGWIPRDRFKGDPAKFTEAADYLARGEELLPLVRAENRNLHNKVETIQGELVATRQALSEATQAIEAFREMNSEEALARMKQSKEDLKARLKTAKEDKDTDAEVEITDQLQQTNAAIVKAETKPTAEEKSKGSGNGNGTADPAQNPDFLRWRAENPWYGSDIRRSYYADGVAQDLRRSGSPLTGREFFDAVTAEVDKIFNPSAASASRVEGARGGAGGNGGGSGSNGKAKSFASMPQDAKDAAERYAKRVVGEGKIYKDRAAFEKGYADKYWSQE